MKIIMPFGVMKISRKYLFLRGIFFLWLCPQLIIAKGVFDFDPGCQRAYQLIFNYDLKGADKIIANEKAANPNNYIIPYLESYSDLLSVFFNEKKADYQAMQKKESERESLLSNAVSNSPYRNFCLSEIYMHDALVRFKFGDNISAAYKLKTAYFLLKECRAKYPEFLPANKDLLVLEGAIGTLPRGYRAILNILGFNGDLKKSTEAYKIYLNKLVLSKDYNLFLEESRVYFAFMNYYLLNESDKAWTMMKEATDDYAESPLSAFFRASMAMRTRHNIELMQALQPYAANPPIPQLGYFYGIGKLQQLDVGGGYYLSHYLRSFSGEGYIKDAYLKLGWAFLLKGDTTSYKNCKILVGKFGGNRFEEDKNALNESKKPTIPDIHLLRARLLYDGGLYQRAIDELTTISLPSLRNKEEQSECIYRLARINEAMGNEKEAIKNYDFVIAKYSIKGLYFPPASCLYLGLIYEKKKNIILARQYFQKCLEFTSYPYEDSFNQKANAGLKRLNIQ